MTEHTSETSVAIQGEFGAFSEVAAREYFAADVAVVPCATFDEMFASVRTGRSQFGMAPVDNSLAGSIHPVWDLLVSERLPIVGELELRVRHCLIGHPGATIEQLRSVQSHGQALAQCQVYLSRLKGVEQVEVYDTAGAVKVVKEHGDTSAAAIASAAAARTYGMTVMARNIQTDANNYTRFLVLANESEIGPSGNCGGRTSQDGVLKSTLVVQLVDNARRLPALLAEFTKNDIEILKVESCKRLGIPWAYTFYLELGGDATAPPLSSVLKELDGGIDLQVIGTYPAGGRRDGNDR